MYVTATKKFKYQSNTTTRHMLMTRTVKILTTGLCAILLLCMLVSPSSAKVFKWHDSSDQSRDLLLLGFGEITMHYLDVNGNADAFEASNPDFEKDFTSHYRLSLFANGNTTSDFTINGAVIVDSRIADEYRTHDPSVFRLRMSVETTEPLWDGWRFTGNSVYDPNRQWELENLDTRLLTTPQEPARMELLMRLASDKYGVIEGGSLRSSFKDAKFTLHERSLFGVYADLHSEKQDIGIEAVGGKLEGKAFREGDTFGIRADGTTGPYDLDNAPVTRGSETVKIEVRDRFDETTVLSSETLLRDRDYTPDYLQGRILLHQPVVSENATGDPVYIVITYDYLRENNDEILGGRANIQPVEGVKVSGTYMKRYLDDQASGIGEDEPENLLAADASIKIKEHTTAYLEAAGSETPNIDDSYSAVRAGVETEAITDLKLTADFQRIEDKFRSFTNSDLNPNKNQQRFKVGGQFDLTDKQTATASFASLRGLEKNGEFNTYDGLLNQDILNLGYNYDMKEEFGFGVGYERRDKKDRDNVAHEKNNQNRFIGKVDGTLSDFAIFGEFGYDVNYEHIKFENEALAGLHDANTDLVAVSLSSKPTERTTFKFTQRYQYTADQEDDLLDERQDASFGSINWRATETLNFLTTGEYKRYDAPNDAISDPFRVFKAGTFAFEYLPLEKIKFFGKIGRNDNKQNYADSTVSRIDDFLQSQLTYFHTHHLSASIENEFRHTARYPRNNSHDKTWDFGAKINWNRDRLNEFTIGLIRRWQVQENPVDDLTSTTYIALLSGSISFTKYFFARASVKGILLEEPMDDEKRFTKIEVGYDSHDWFRLSLGYERIENDLTDNYLDQEYTGQGVFVRFSGKL